MKKDYVRFLVLLFVTLFIKFYFEEIKEISETQTSLTIGHVGLLVFAFYVLWDFCKPKKVLYEMELNLLRMKK